MNTSLFRFYFSFSETFSLEKYSEDKECSLHPTFYSSLNKSHTIEIRKKKKHNKVKKKK